jgi:hypothetical protein
LVDITFRIWRVYPHGNDIKTTEDGRTDVNFMAERDKFYDKQRAQLMNELIKKYDLKVEKNNEWNKMNSDQPHEWVEITLAIINAGVLTAIISAYQS